MALNWNIPVDADLDRIATEVAKELRLTKAQLLRQLVLKERDRLENENVMIARKLK